MKAFADFTMGRFNIWIHLCTNISTGRDLEYRKLRHRNDSIKQSYKHLKRDTQTNDKWHGQTICLLDGMEDISQPVIQISTFSVIIYSDMQQGE